MPSGKFSSRVSLGEFLRLVQMGTCLVVGVCVGRGGGVIPAAMNTPPLDLDVEWRHVEQWVVKLKNFIEGLDDTPLSSEDYMMAYASVYNMCTQKPPHDYSQQLYDRYGQEIRKYLLQTVLPSLRCKHNEFLLKEFVQRWENHKVMVRWLAPVFHYLDRYFISRRSLPSLRDIGISCFRSKVFEEIKSKIRDAVIALINQDRDGNQVDKSLLKNFLDVYIEYGIEEIQSDFYEKDFEVYLLEETRIYYSRKASSWIGQDYSHVEDICHSYWSKVEECLKKEKEIISQVLLSRSERKLMEIVHHELFTVYSKQLLEMELSYSLALVKDNKMEDLTRMYRNHKISQFLEPVAKIFKEHVIAEGTALVSQGEDAASNKASDEISARQQVLVVQIIELHHKYLAYVTDCFSNHFLFHKALNESFRTFFNWGPSGLSSGEMLAIYCDNILKAGGNRKLTDETVEKALGKVVELVAYVGDRDLFAEFYRRKLFRRLLVDQSVDEDREKWILTRFKQQYGPYFTSKMETMVKDLELTKDIKTEFEQYLSSDKIANPGVDLTVRVLTSGFWPSTKTTDLNLPSEMVKSMEAFTDFFQRRRKNQKLTWIYSLGNCTLNGNFDPKPIELIVSTYQAAILLLFNGSDRFGYEDIKAQSNMAENDVMRVLHSLSCAKYKILNKYPSTKTILATDEFEFNAMFTDRMRRIKISLPPAEDRRKTIEDVDRDRRFAIDASIVRIMKMRKVLSHQQLVAECIEQLSRLFKPKVRAIKKQIEDLIFREYLERDKDNPISMRYLA
ncbi:cullin-1 isoform X1 [Eucalyptus grandis]|uniref:cullin-1 isoform X1 n=2 Tax=Eucalyptus grandis TaxID=71139 RepID=UPI00192E9977|nr:cullin-1 isoform X1 [Eucalyptus grandis]